MGISVVLNTLNEEKNIENALRSVKEWADEIIVVDMHSEDQTTEIARRYGAKVFFFERMGYSEPARAFAVQQATHPWILILDADEMVPKPLSQLLLQTMQQDQHDVVMLPRLNYLIGKDLHHTGWGPEQDYQTRFFKRTAIEFRPIIHKYMNIDPQARILRVPYQEGHGIVHFNYLNLAQFVEKLGRYTTIEARQLHDKKAAPKSPFAVLLVACKEFVWRYWIKGGYRDGWRGFYLSWMMVFYRLLTHGKHHEMSEGLDEARIKADYQQVANRVLREYP